MRSAAQVLEDIQTDEAPEDFTYSAELEAQDPFFNRATQAELARRIKDIDAGRNIVHKTMEELETMAND